MHKKKPKISHKFEVLVFQKADRNALYSSDKMLITAKDARIIHTDESPVVNIHLDAFWNSSINSDKTSDT